MFLCNSSPNLSFTGVHKYMFTFFIVLFKNVTQKETSDGLINGGISCDFVTLKENLGRSVH